MKFFIHAACTVLLLFATLSAQAAKPQAIWLTPSDQDLLAPTCPTAQLDASIAPGVTLPNSSSQCNTTNLATQGPVTSVPEAPMVAMLLIGLGLLSLTRRTTTEKFKA